MLVLADLLSVLGVILGTVAIVVGLVGIVIALMLGGDQIASMQRVHEEQMDAVTKVGQSQLNELEHVHAGLETTLDKVRGDVATHYIGQFPDIVEDIVRVIESADRQLTIFCDLPAYGVVSNPEWFAKYTEAIRDRVRDDRVDVCMVHLDKTARRAGLERQFYESWETICKNPNVEGFIESRGRTIASLDKEGFIGLVEREQVDALNAFKQAAGTREMKAAETGAIMPMYFWIANGKRAVFALTQWERNAREVGFWTRSENLIKAMQGIYDRYADEAPPKI